MQHRRQTRQRVARRQPSLPRPIHRQHLARFAHGRRAAQRYRFARQTVERALHHQPIAGQHTGGRLDAPILGVRTVHIPIGRNGGHIFGVAHLTQADLRRNVPRLRQHGENRYASGGQSGSRAIGDAVSFGDDALATGRNDVPPFRMDT